MEVHQKAVANVYTVRLRSYDLHPDLAGALRDRGMPEDVTREITLELKSEGSDVVDVSSPAISWYVPESEFRKSFNSITGPGDYREEVRRLRALSDEIKTKERNPQSSVIV